MNLEFPNGSGNFIKLRVLYARTQFESVFVPNASQIQMQAVGLTSVDERTAFGANLDLRCLSLNFAFKLRSGAQAVARGVYPVDRVDPVETALFFDRITGCTGFIFLQTGDAKGDIAPLPAYFLKKNIRKNFAWQYG